ncbi:hypothetical protein [Lysinibacillus sp.]|uniref:hypothetical protein n=1 Tax=Lysinibacillus sp. TaxID=1869345 RepID=UPI002896C845|nr:hypothetical protein [Lysinibacillus sp.]
MEYLKIVQQHKLPTGVCVDEYLVTKYKNSHWMKHANVVEYSALSQGKRVFYKWLIQSKEIVANNDNAKEITPEPIKIV